MGWGNFGAGSIPVKEEELSESTVRSEMLCGPFFKLGQAKGFPFFGEVELAEETIDPDIDGEGIPTAVGVEQDAARNFRSHPG